MAAKKTRKGVTPHKSKRRAVKKKKASIKRKMKARTKPKVQPAADTLDLPSFLPMADDNPPPMPFRNSQLPMVNWKTSLDPTPWMPQMQRNAALLASSGAGEPPWPPSTSDPNVLRVEIIKRSEIIQQAITNLREQQHGGIGHNNPPFSEQELDEISDDLAVLKKQSPATTPSAETTAAVTRLSKFGAYLLKLGDVYLTEFVKEAGKRSIQAPLWLTIYYELPKLADLAQQWLHLLPHP